MSSGDDPLPREDMKLEDLDRFLASVSFENRLESLNDPHLSWYLQRQDFGNRSLTKKGRILQALPYFGWYRVAVEDQIGVIPCCRLSSVATSTIYGTIDTAVFPADTAVLVEIHPSNPWGYILGAIPSVLEDGNFNFSDWVVQGSHAGFREGYHSHYITKTDDEGGVQNFSSQRPLDNLLTDGGLTTTTGVGNHVDPLLAYTRVSEVCGIFAFYPAEHLLVTGRSLEISSGAHTEDARDDEGELTYFRGETPYPWEMMGAPEVDAQVLREVSDNDVHTKRTEAKLEPLHADQAALFRYEEYGGYLGQGRIRQMAVPLPESSGLNRRSAPLDRLGVFREHIGLEGDWLVQTAHSLTIAKQAIIPIAERIEEQSSYTAAADSAENNNYKFAGQFGSGEEHKLAELTYQDAETTMVTIVGLLDNYSYLSNWKDLLGFHYHKGDFKLPQAAANKKLTTDQAALDFYELQTGSFSPPEATEVTIDARYKAKFYKLLTMLHFTNDGNLVLRGGRGCQITFQDGDLYLDAPGNIYQRSGKSVVALAGDDLILRAKQCLEATASDGSIRMKAEKDYQMLAGNGGTGGMLLECRSTGKDHNYPYEGGEKVQGTGVTIKTKSQFNAMAGEIYLRTGGPKGNAIPSGPIVLDASQGTADIIQIASTHQRFAKNSVIDSFNYPKVTYVSVSTGAVTRFGGVVQALGDIRSRGSINSKNGFATSDGHFQSQAGGQVGRMRNPEIVRLPLDQINEGHTENKTTQTDYYDQRVDREYYRVNKIGNEEVQKEISFGCRNEKEYGTANLLLPQAHWQQLAEGSGATVAWQEKVVKYQDKTETMPWPGKKMWKDSSILCALPAAQHSMYDLNEGRSKNRPDPYLAPKYGKLDKRVCNDRYLVISVPSN